MSFQFKRAVKSQKKLRLAIAGPSGAGKTFTALQVAKGLGGKIALIDTEKSSASLYSDGVEFDTLDLGAPFTPAKFVEAIKAAQEAHYGVLIIDSLSPAWNGEGGALDMVTEAQKRSKSGNSFAAWKDVTPEHNKLMQAILGADMHVIATLRAKQAYVQEKNEKGYTVVRKVGMAPEQREGVEYEFDIVGDMNVDHEFIVSKTRYSNLTDRVLKKPGAELGKEILTWLTSGAPAVVAPQDRTVTADSLPALQDFDLFSVGIQNATKKTTLKEVGLAVAKAKEEGRISAEQAKSLRELYAHKEAALG